MQELQVPDKTPIDVERFYKQLFDGAQGSIIELTAIPTGDALQAGQIGHYNNVIYLVTPGGTKLKSTWTTWS